MLIDGKFHELEEMQMKTALSDEQMRAVVAFFAEYGFIQIDKGNDAVRIRKSARNLLEIPK